MREVLLPLLYLWMPETVKRKRFIPASPQFGENMLRLTHNVCLIPISPLDDTVFHIGTQCLAIQENPLSFCSNNTGSISWSSENVFVLKFHQILHYILQLYPSWKFSLREGTTPSHLPSKLSIFPCPPLLFIFIPQAKHTYVCTYIYIYIYM